MSYVYVRVEREGSFNSFSSNGVSKYLMKMDYFQNSLCALVLTCYYQQTNDKHKPNHKPEKSKKAKKALGGVQNGKSINGNVLELKENGKAFFMNLIFMELSFTHFEQQTQHKTIKLNQQYHHQCLQ